MHDWELQRAHCIDCPAEKDREIILVRSGVSGSIARIVVKIGLVLGVEYTDTEGAILHIDLSSLDELIVLPPNINGFKDARASNSDL